MDSIGFSGFHASKLVSMALLIAVGSLLYWIHSAPQWFVYRDSMIVEGTRLVSEDELFALSETDGWNLLWLREDVIREHLLRHRWLSDAQIQFVLPSTIEVEVSEQPAIALWVTEEGASWIAANGAVRAVEGEAPTHLLRLVDPNMHARTPENTQTSAGEIAGETAVDTGIVQSALALIQRIPGLTEVRYSREVGLNFGLPGTELWVYWGDGRNVDKKLEHITLGRKLLDEGGARGSVLDVRYPEAPFVR